MGVFIERKTGDVVKKIWQSWKDTSNGPRLNLHEVPRSMVYTPDSWEVQPNINVKAGDAVKLFFKSQGRACKLWYKDITLSMDMTA